MKILIVQLARLGDIYMTWPVIRGLRRKYPDADIEMLVRPKFVAATEGLVEVTKVRQLPMENIFKPIIDDDKDVVSSLTALNSFVNELESENYDQIINLSFSPASSYLVHTISNAATQVYGYTRTSDGFLAIPDDNSAYFYAQVGPGKGSRVHLVDLFAAIADVDLNQDDFKSPIEEVEQKNQIVVHIGASDLTKTLSCHKWIMFVKKLIESTDAEIVLIGAASEIEIGNSVQSVVDNQRLVNMVGKTTLPELIEIIAAAKLVVGGDSVPLHISMLTKTKVLNISLGPVNFWETGPRTIGSFVLPAEEEGALPADLIAQCAIDIMNGQIPKEPGFMATVGVPSFMSNTDNTESFQWLMMKALYMGAEFPEPVNATTKSGLIQLAETNSLIFEQIEFLENGKSVKFHGSVIERGEEVITTIGQLCPELGPLVRWYQAEKSRIGPGTHEYILQQTRVVQQAFSNVLSVYVDEKREENHEKAF
jgi:heptosyltransferase III